MVECKKCMETEQTIKDLINHFKNTKDKRVVNVLNSLLIVVADSEQ